MFKKTILVLIVLIIAYFLANSGNQNKDVIKIGYIGPLTGEVSSLGVPTRKAVELAVQEINDQGGINGRKIELISEDGACNSKRALDAGNKLMNIDRVVAIIGGFCSGETSSFGPNAMKNKTIVISPASSSPILSKLGKYFFRVYPSDEYQGKFAAEYIYQNMGIRKVAILYSNTDWGVHITDVFKREYESLGGNIVFNEGTSQDTRDFKTVISKIKESQAELLFAPQYTEGSLVLVEQLSSLGLNIAVLGADAWADSKFQKEVRLSGTAFKNGGLMYVEVKTEPSDDFVTKFSKAYPEEKIGVGAAQGYDAANILLNSIKIAGTEDADKLAETIRSIKFDGVSNDIIFDEHGDMVHAEYVVKKIVGGGKVEVHLGK